MKNLCSKFICTAFLLAVIVLPTAVVVFLNNPPPDQNVAAAAAEGTSTTTATTTNTTSTHRVRRRSILDQYPPLAGGYFAVANFEEDPVILEAATFVLQQVLSSSPLSSQANGNSNSNSDNSGNSGHSNSNTAAITDFRIVEASEQVVAGLNIRLTMLFQNGQGDCVGACTVLVYNHFGDLSVTNWNTELSCEDIANDNDADADADNDIIVLEDFSNPMHVWKEMNDPVMGGKSIGTFHIEHGLGRFVGEVVDVPFLHAPGFIKGHTTDHTVFPDITSCQALQLIAKSNTDYSGYRISFGRAHAPGGKFFAYGYKANLGDFVPTETFGKITIPLSQFTDFWDDATGEPIHTCQEDSRFCPDEMTLKNLQVLEIWGEGVGGRVDLEIQRIQAVGCMQ